MRTGSSGPDLQTRLSVEGAGDPRRAGPPVVPVDRLPPGRRASARRATGTSHNEPPWGSHVICLAISVAGFDLPQLLLMVPTLAFGAWFLLTWWRENDDNSDDPR
jgi:hypothetical protein